MLVFALLGLCIGYLRCAYMHNTPKLPSDCLAVYPLSLNPLPYVFMVILVVFVVHFSTPFFHPSAPPVKSCLCTAHPVPRALPHFDLAHLSLGLTPCFHVFARPVNMTFRIRDLVGQQR